MNTPMCGRYLSRIGVHTYHYHVLFWSQMYNWNRLIHVHLCTFSNCIIRKRENKVNKSYNKLDITEVYTNYMLKNNEIIYHETISFCLLLKLHSSNRTTNTVSIISYDNSSFSIFSDQSLWLKMHFWSWIELKHIFIMEGWFTWWLQLNH
jgi:hypothetical protein